MRLGEFLGWDLHGHAWSVASLKCFLSLSIYGLSLLKGCIIGRRGEKAYYLFSFSWGVEALLILIELILEVIHELIFR